VPVNFISRSHELRSGRPPYPDGEGRFSLLGIPDGDVEVSGGSAAGMALFLRMNLPRGDQVEVRVPE
jgi:hypothetical protein